MDKKIQWPVARVVVFLSPSQAGGFSGHQGAVSSVANQMELKTGEMPSFEAVASELGRRAIQGMVHSVAIQMKEKTGEMPSLEVTASELGRRGNQGAVHRMAKRMELKTWEMPSLDVAASERGSTSGRKSVGTPKGNAVWAKVVQISGSDEEIQGTEKCGDTKSKICAELCHQGIGLSFTTCVYKYIGKWFKYAGEFTYNSTIIFHANTGNKRWKLTILTAKSTDVEEVCEKVYLKESNFHRERSAEGKVQSRSYNNLSTV